MLATRFGSLLTTTSYNPPTAHAYSYRYRPGRVGGIEGGFCLIANRRLSDWQAFGFNSGSSLPIYLGVRPTSWPILTSADPACGSWRVGGLSGMCLWHHLWC